MKNKYPFMRRIFFTLFIVTNIIFFYIEVLFYIYYVDTDMPLLERLSKAFFDSTSVYLGIALTFIASIIITKTLSPLAKALNDPSLIKKADERIRQFYKIVFIVLESFFIVGTIVGIYLIDAMHELFFNLSVSAAAGLVTISIIWQKVGIIIAPIRQKLNLLHVVKGKYDVSFMRRIALMIFSSGLLYYTTALFIGNYYISARTNDAGPYYLGLIINVFFVSIFSIWQITSITNLYTKAITSIKKVLSGLSGGGSNLSDRIPLSSYDEIGELASEFNNFMSFLNLEMMDNLSKTARVVFDSSFGLSSSSQEATATSNQQAAAVKEIVTTMEDLSTIIHDMSLRLSHVNDLSQSTLSKASDGVASIDRSLEMFSSVKSTTVATIDKITSLNEQIVVITDIVKIIEKIASQIRIIAFNASLEATAAGDAGRNFQVVADEVKRLADNTMASAKDIRSKVSLILASADEVATVSKQSSEVIEEGWDIVAQLPAVFEDIQSSAKESATEISHADLSAHQQVEAFEQVLTTLKEIARGVESFSIATKHTASTSNALKATADELSTMIMRYTGRTQ